MRDSTFLVTRLRGAQPPATMTIVGKFGHIDREERGVSRTSAIPLSTIAVVVSFVVVLGSWILVSKGRIFISEILLLSAAFAFGDVVTRHLGRTTAEQRWLRSLFQMGLAARVVLAIVLYCSFLLISPESKGLFHEDAALYVELGEAAADQWRASGIAATDSVPIYSTGATLYLKEDSLFGMIYLNGMLYLNASVFFLLGHDVLLLVLLSCLIGALIGALIYSICMAFCSETTARRAAMLSTFYPGLLLYSTVPYKDIYVTFLMTLMISAYLQLRRQFKWSYPIILIVAFLVLGSVRWKYLLPCAFLLALGWLYDETRRWNLKQVVIGSVTTLLALIALVAVDWSWLEGMSGSLSSEALGNFVRVDEGWGEGSPRLDSFYTLTVRGSEGITGTLAVLPMIIGFVLILPFPGWNLTHLDLFQAWATAPEVIVWHLMLPFLLIGFYRVFWKGVQVPRILILAVLIFLAVLAVGTMGNVGSLRHRLLITPFVIIFISLGIEGFKGAAGSYQLFRRGLVLGMYYVMFALLNLYYLSGKLI